MGSVQSAKGNLGASVASSLRPTSAFTAKQHPPDVVMDTAEYVFESVPRLSARLGPAHLIVGTAPTVCSQGADSVSESVRENCDPAPGNRRCSEDSPELHCAE